MALLNKESVNKESENNESSINLIRPLSISAKIRFFFILSGMSLIILFTHLVHNIYFEDKLKYVSISQQQNLALIKKNIQIEISKKILTARAVIATFDFNQRVFTNSGQQIFNDEKNLLAIQLWNETKNKSLMHIEKESHILPPVTIHHRQLATGVTEWQALENEKYLILMKYDHLNQGSLILRLVVNLKDILGSNNFNIGELQNNNLPKSDLLNSDLLNNNEFIKNENQIVGLIRGKNIIVNTESQSLPKEILVELINDSHERLSNIHEWSSNKNDYLVASEFIGFENLQLVSMLRKDAAVGGLSNLFGQSITFLLLTFFVLSLCIVLITRRLSLQLKILATFCLQLKDNLSKNKPFNSKIEKWNSFEETNIIASSFHKMYLDLQVLLKETKEDIRQQQIIKTSIRIQEGLMPENFEMKLNQFEFSGVCQSDAFQNVKQIENGTQVVNKTNYQNSNPSEKELYTWWTCFSQGDQFFLAKAEIFENGLDTAIFLTASKTLFSYLKNQSMDLQQMFQAWQKAVAECSENSFIFSGILLQLDTLTGQGNALFRQVESDQLEFDSVEDTILPIFLKMKKNGLYQKSPISLTEKDNNQFSHLQFKLDGNDSIILTNFIIQQQEEGVSTDSFDMLDSIIGQAEFATSAQKLNQFIFEDFKAAQFEDFMCLRNSVPKLKPCVLTLRRIGTKPKVILANEFGEAEGLN